MRDTVLGFDIWDERSDVDEDAGEGREYERVSLVL